MTKKDLLLILANLPDETEIYVRSGDNAWPAAQRMFKYQGKFQNVLYLETSSGNHRNFPEGYNGVEEVKLPC